MKNQLFYNILISIFDNYKVTSDSISIATTDKKTVQFQYDENDPERYGPNGNYTCISICPLDKDDYDSDVWEDFESYDTELREIYLKHIISISIKDNKLFVEYKDGSFGDCSESFEISK